MARRWWQWAVLVAVGGVGWWWVVIVWWWWVGGGVGTAGCEDLGTPFTRTPHLCMYCRRWCWHHFRDLQTCSVHHRPSTRFYFPHRLAHPAVRPYPSLRPCFCSFFLHACVPCVRPCSLADTIAEGGGGCEDVDECATDEPNCEVHQFCANTPGTFECKVRQFRHILDHFSRSFQLYTGPHASCDTLY